MTTGNETAETIGRTIGRAIARDVLAEGMSPVWMGLDAQDHDQIPEGMDPEAIERAARAAYHEYLAAQSSAPAAGLVRCQACGELKPREEMADRLAHNTGGEVQCLTCHRELIDHPHLRGTCPGCEREED